MGPGHRRTHYGRRVRRIYIRLSWVLIVAFAILLGHVLWLTFSSYSDVSVTNNAHVSQSVYHPGDSITVKIDELCNSGHALVLTAFLVNSVTGATATLETVTYPKPTAPVCLAAQIERVPLLKTVTPGQWSLRLDYSYRPNLFITVTKTVTTDSFIVEEKDV